MFVQAWRTQAADGGIARRWPHTALFCLGWGKWVDLCAVQRLLVRYGVRAEPDNAWNFNTNDGNQNADNQNNAFYASGCTPRRMMPREEEG